MNDFWHFARLAAARRWTLVCIVSTSLLVALLWGTNIAAIYPIVEAVFAGKGAAQSVEGEIEKLQTLATTASQEISRLEVELTDTDLPDLQQAINRSLSERRSRREAYEGKAATLKWCQPWAKQYLPETPFRTLLVVLTLLLAGTVVKLIAFGVNLMLVQELVQRTALEMRGLLFRQSLRMDQERFGEHGSGPLLSRLTQDIEYVADGMQSVFGRLVREPLKLVVCLSIAAWICWPLLVLILAASPLLAVGVSSLSRSIRRANRRVMEEMTQLYSQVNQSLAAIRIVKAYNAQGYERARFHMITLQYYRRTMRLALYNALGRPMSELLGMAMVALALMAGGYLVLNQQTYLLGIPMSAKPLEFGEVMLFFAALIGASDPAKKMSEVWGSLQRAAASANRIREALKSPVRVTEPVKPIFTARPHQSLRFVKVSYRYPSSSMVLEGLDLEIPFGETLAIVGPNGSGKSTLVSLLCRLDDPVSGQILLDEAPINLLSLRDLRRRIGLVTQHPVVFEDSILNNIRYGSRGTTRDQVIDAARNAYADEFICEKLSNGYDTVIGHNGTRLSGGQMQRLALARAMLRNPDIMILDEATSQIDVESEQLIHHALQKYLQDRTGIIITHRPSTLALADRIAVLEDGRLSDCGSHDVLLSRNAFYRSLCGEPTNYRKTA